MFGENLFLIVLAFIWIIVAVIQDFRKREVANWLNFSLIAVALAYRAFVSISILNYWYLLYGLFGFVVFFALANVFYYSRVFAGGDAKLLIGLGAILAFSSSVIGNLMIFLYFVALLLFGGGFWGIGFSIFLVSKNKKKFNEEFKKQFEKIKEIFDKIVFLSVLSAVFFIIIDAHLLVVLSILFLVFPLIYAYAKTVEESCMIKSVDVKELTVGDWLYQEVKVGKKKIKPNWEGLSEQELRFLQKKRGKVKIKQGIPFTPAFLFAFVILLWFLF